MMKIYTTGLRLLFLSLLFCGLSVHAQNPFRKEYQVNGYHSGNTMFTKTLDRGILLLANLESATLTYYFNVVKTDSAGNVQWVRTFGPVEGWPKKIHTTPDSGFVFCYADLNSPQGYRLVKLNKNGALVFSQLVTPPSPWFIPYYGLVTMMRSDGGFYVASYLLDMNTDDHVWHLCSFDSSGALIWSKGYNLRADKVFLADIDTCSNGDVVMLGDFWDSTAQVNTPLVTRVQSDGTWLWSKYYTGSVSIYPRSVETSGNEIFATTIALFSGYTEMILMKLDSSGTTQWSYRYGAPQASLDFPQTTCLENGNIVLMTESFGNTYFLKTDSVGTVLTGRLFFDINAYGIDTLNSTEYVFSGRSSTGYHATLFTTDYSAQGCNDTAVTFTKAAFPVTVGPYYSPYMINVQQSSPALTPVSLSLAVHEACNPMMSVDDGQDSFPVQVFPNPATDVVQFTAAEQIGNVEIIDLNGKVVITGQCSTTTVRFDISVLPAGLYCVRIQNENGVFTKKMLVAR